MKFTAITATLFTVFALSRAIPITWPGDVEALVERSSDGEVNARQFDFEKVDAREFEETFNARDLELMELEARTGPFASNIGTTKKNQAKEFVQQGKQGGQLANAAAPGNSAATKMENNIFHLDRQQPTNSQGQRKVAVQFNRVRAGHPSTVGQVAIHGNANPSSNRVAKKLKSSIHKGEETHINHPNSKAAKNIAKNQAASAAKTARNAAKSNAGQARAAAGNFRKGQGKKSAEKKSASS